MCVAIANFILRSILTFKNFISRLDGCSLCAGSYTDGLSSYQVNSGSLPDATACFMAVYSPNSTSVGVI